jgi:hypothetical protein
LILVFTMTVTRRKPAAPADKIVVAHSEVIAPPEARASTLDENVDNIALELDTGLKIDAFDDPPVAVAVAAKPAKKLSKPVVVAQKHQVALRDLQVHPVVETFATETATKKDGSHVTAKRSLRNKK